MTCPRCDHCDGDLAVWEAAVAIATFRPTGSDLDDRLARAIRQLVTERLTDVNRGYTSSGRR